MSHLTQALLQQPDQTYYIELPHYSAVHVTGPDAATFLQGQLTTDVQQQKPRHWQFTGHCNAQGKLWSISRLFGSGDTFQLVMPQDNLEDTLREFNKFGVFSKLTCTDRSAELSWFACWGPEAREQANKLTGLELAPNQSAHWDEHRVILALAPDLMVVATPQPPAVVMQPAYWWTAIRLQYGWPELPASQSAQHIPQTLNLDRLDAIDWRKGCYIGQETIARMHYRGQTKRRLCTLQGHAAQPLTTDHLLERQVGENWRRAGAVFDTVRYDDGVVAIQAVLPVDIEPDSVLRIKGQDDSKFTICPPQAEITEFS